MNITCDITDLKRGLAQIGHTYSTRGSLPILSHLLLEATDGYVQLTTTNLEMTVCCQIPAQVHVAGKTTVLAKVFIDYITMLTSPSVTLASLPDGAPGGINITADRKVANLRGIDPAEFPHVGADLSSEHSEAIYTLDSEALKYLIQSTSIAVAVDDSRPVFTSIVMETVDASHIAFVAADTFRLALKIDPVTYTTAPAIGTKILVPGRSMDVLVKLLPSTGQIMIHYHPNFVWFRYAGADALIQRTEGAFPQYQSIIPTETAITAQVDRKQLLGAIKQALLFTKNVSGNTAVTMTLQEHTVAVSASEDDGGDVYAEIDATGIAPDTNVAILLNAQFLRDVLEVMQTDQVVIRANTPQTPIILQPYETDTTYTHVIMPLYKRGR